MRRPGLSAAALACVWLAVSPGCDAVTKEQNTREYVDDLVTELCAPGAFYRDCWWQSSCHREMPTWVANSWPTSGQRLQPSEALRQHVLERLFFFHYGMIGSVLRPAFENQACLDETHWKHVPPGKVGDMARLRARRTKSGQEPNAPSAPATTPAP